MCRHDASQRQRLVARHAAIPARRQFGLCHLVMHAEQLGGIRKVVPGAQAGRIGRHHLRHPLEFLHHPFQQRLQRAIVQPQRQAQREEVLAAFALRLGHPRRRRGFLVQAAHRHRDQAVVIERAVLQRVGIVLGLLQIRRREGVLVRDDDAALLQFRQAYFQGRRVHCDQHKGGVSRRGDALIAKTQLVSADAAQGTNRGTDVRGKIRKRANRAAGHQCDVGELAADQLHAVA